MMTKKTFKKLIQLYSFILLLVGCSTDETDAIQIDNATITKPSEEFSIRISNTSTSNLSKTIKTVFDNTTKNLNQNRNNSESVYSVDDSFINIITYNNYTSYTGAVTLDTVSTIFQNIVVSEFNNHTSKVELFTYELDIPKDDFINSGYNKDHIINITKEIDYTNSFGHTTERLSSRCVSFYETQEVAKCEHDLRPGPDCYNPDGSEIQVTVVIAGIIDCSIGGGSDIPGDSTGYNGWNGTNGSSGGGGGSSTNNQNNNSDPNCIADANGNCAGTLTTPLLPDSTLIEDLGNKRLLKDLMAETSFQTHFEILKTASIATAEKREILYAGLTNDAGETIFSYVGQSPINGAEVEIINPIIGEISSLFHNHYAGSSNQGNLLPTFSAADVSNIFSLAYTSQIQDLNDFNLLLVTPQQDLQALMITNRELFNARLMTWGGFPEQLVLFLENSYEENLIVANTASENGAMKLNNILRDYGLTVYQFNENTDRWFKP